MVQPDGTATTLRLRRMALEDVPRVVAIERAGFDAGWPHTAFERELTGNRMAHYIVLERQHACGESELIGFAGMWLMVDQAHVVTVAVTPEERRNGYGRLLVHALVGLAAAEGASDATLEVRLSNDAARALYREYGFYEVGERKRYYSNGEDAVIMTTEGFDTDAYQARLRRLEHVLAGRFPGVSPSIVA